MLQRDLVQAYNPKVKIWRERKAKERCRMFHIERLAAWAEDLDTNPQEPEPEKIM